MKTAAINSARWVVYGSLSGKGSAWGGRLWRFGADRTVSWFEVCSDWFWFKSKVQTWSSLEYNIYSSPCSFSVSQNSCGCLLRKAQQVSWLHSVGFRLKFLCLSLISAVMSSVQFVSCCVLLWFWSIVSYVFSCCLCLALYLCQVLLLCIGWSITRHCTFFTWWTAIRLEKSGAMAFFIWDWGPCQ